MAQVEYRLKRIENTNAQLQETIAPGGYITDAFERVVDRIDEVEDRLNTRIDSQDAKLDTILHHYVVYNVYNTAIERF